VAPLQDGVGGWVDAVDAHAVPRPDEHRTASRPWWVDIFNDRGRVGSDVVLGKFFGREIVVEYRRPLERDGSRGGALVQDRDVPIARTRGKGQKRNRGGSQEAPHWRSEP